MYDTIFIRKHLARLIALHNLIGYMNTLTYEDVFFMQYRLRKIIKGMEHDLGITAESLVGIPCIVANGNEKKYLCVDE